MTTFNHCRFCDNWRDQNLIRYSTRHYAHPRCYLDAGKSIDDLRDWQLAEQFPFLLLKERGLLPKVNDRLVGYFRKQEATRDHQGTTGGNRD